MSGLSTDGYYYCYLKHQAGRKLRSLRKAHYFFMNEISKRGVGIKPFIWLGAISVVAGTMLMIMLRVVFFLTGNPAYRLLFNFDYIPVLNQFQTLAFAGYLFHYFTCFFSVLYANIF